MGKINLTQDSIRMMRIVQRKYEMDYVAFYKSLAGHFIGQKQIVSDITAARNRVESVIKAIEDILNPFEDVTQDKINELYASMDSVEKDIKFFTDEAKKDAELNEKMQRIFEKRNLDIDRLGQSHKMIRGRMEKMVKEATRVKFPRIAPEITDFAADIGKTALSSVLGPFGRIAGLAGKVVGGIIERRRGRERTLGEKAFAGAVLTAEEETPEALSKMYTSLFGAGKASVEADVTSGYRPTRRGAEEFATRVGRRKWGREAPEETFTGRGLRGGIAHEDFVPAFSLALMTFFNIGWRKAKWTREMLESIQTISGVKSKGLAGAIGEKATGMWEIFKGIGLYKLLEQPIFILVGYLLRSIILPALLIALAGIAGAVVGWLVGHIKIGDKTINEYTQSFMSKLYPFETQSKLAPYIAERGMATPIGRRSLELTRIHPGMNMREAVRQAYSELGEQGLRPSVVPKSEQPTSQFIDRQTGFGTSTVPIVIGGLEKTNKEGFDRVNSNLVAMRDEMKAASPKSVRVNMRSGYDAYNIRNPLLSALNHGGIDIG